LQVNRLLGRFAIGAIDFGGGSRGEQRSGLGMKTKITGKTIASHNAACRMQNHAMTNLFALRVKGPLYLKGCLSEVAN
jgi:hypothetical protein